MTLRLGNVVIDCEHPTEVARFWSAALALPVDDGASEFFVSLGSDEPGPTMFLIKVPEPKTTKNRLHLDLLADDRANEIERLVGLGATHVADKHEWGHSWAVLRDPEGNEFCVAESPQP
ncbi:MAG: VOC family protein [Actinomycetota bacterium]